MTLTKIKISEHLIKKFNLNKHNTKKIVELFFEELRCSLEQGEQVKLSSFGNFNIRNKKQRPGRNPKTKEKILVTARKVVVFRPGKKLKIRIKNFN